MKYIFKNPPFKTAIAGFTWLKFPKYICESMHMYTPICDEGV